MEVFLRALAERQTGADGGRRWLFVPYDQLSDAMGPLAREDPQSLGIVLVENPAKAAQRPYHRQKLALLLTNLRHFALEQAQRGVRVRHVVHAGPYRDALTALLPETGPMRMMAPAERELREDVAPLVAAGDLDIIPHEGWLTPKRWFVESFPKGPPYRMDGFYRRARKETGILIDEAGGFEGGKLSFDAENRKPWRGSPAAPEPPVFPPDAITNEVLELVRTRFAHHPGELTPHALPATADDAERLWRFALASCLPHFGPYEDAMSRASSTLFHTRISPLLNLHRLLPRRVVEDVERAPIPLQSREGFIRQVLGWREFMHHVHDVTEGFRQLPTGDAKAARSRLVGAQPVVPPRGAREGAERRRADAAPSSSTSARDLPPPLSRDGGAAPSFLQAEMPLPPAYWGTRSGLACLDHVVEEVWRDGYTHHINRLMVLSNLATLLGIKPRELTDWFWVGFLDAYDWVVEPNVLGMGTFGLGELFVTKPYVSGAAYLERMSDYCGACAFHPKKNCPVTRMYWAFLGENEERLRANVRMAMPLRSWSKRSPAQQTEDRRVLRVVQDHLQQGRALGPDALAVAPDTGGRAAPSEGGRREK